MRCPYCKSNKNWRMKTPRWAKYPSWFMRNRRCSDCRKEFIRCLGIVSMGHPAAHRIKNFLTAFLLLAAFLLVVKIGARLIFQE